MPTAYNGVVIGTTPVGSTLVGNPLPVAAVDSLGKVRTLRINDDGELLVTGGSSGGGVVTQPDASLLNTTAVQGGTWNVGLSAGANAIGSVSVSNFPATQPVSGTVTANLGTIGAAATAASQTNVQSAPGTPQTVAITVQGNASGVAIPVSLSGTATVSGTVAATQSGAWTNTVTQATGTNLHTVVDSGTLTANIGTTNGLALDASVTALQVAQASNTSGQNGALALGAATTAAPSYTTAKSYPLSLTTTGDLRVSQASQPLPTGAATDAVLTGGTQQTRITNGTNVSDVIAPASGQNSLLVAGGGQPISFTTSSVQAVATTDLQNMRGVSIQINTQGTSSLVTWQTSNDNSSWFGFGMMPSTAIGATTPAAAAGGTGLWYGVVPGRYLRLNVTGISAGTTAGVINAFSMPGSSVTSAIQAFQGSTWTVQQGSTPSATPWATNPVAAATGGYTYSHLAANATTTIKSGAGYLRSIVINTPGATDTITVYDNTAGSGTVIAIINDATASAGGLVYDLAFTTGLTVVLAGTTPPDITVMYK